MTTPARIELTEDGIPINVVLPLTAAEQAHLRDLHVANAPTKAIRDYLGSLNLAARLVVH